MYVVQMKTNTLISGGASVLEIFPRYLYTSNVNEF